MQTETVKFLNEIDVVNIENIIRKNYDADVDLKRFCLIETAEEKIWLASKDVSEIPLDKIELNSIGMYFGKLKRNEKIHLSIEGCQLIGKSINRNVIEFDRKIAENFLKGENIGVQDTPECDPHNFVVIKCGDDFFGSGLLVEGHIENLTPKSRRMPL